MNSYILDPLVKLYGGKVYPQKNSFKWIVDGKEEIQDIIEYFTVCPSRTGKQHRLKLVPKYLELRKLKAHLAPETSIYGKAWKILLSQWNRYKFKE